MWGWAPGPVPRNCADAFPVAMSMTIAAVTKVLIISAPVRRPRHCAGAPLRKGSNSVPIEIVRAGAMSVTDGSPQVRVPGGRRAPLPAELDLGGDVGQRGVGLDAEDAGALRIDGEHGAAE